ncbi:hypothetical protein SAMN05444172_2588 [Burkholderia sp. GAS332]|nr:hypothetical protein SAMN05444172_2588 [Burkholderia sp. GAS332]
MGLQTNVGRGSGGGSDDSLLFGADSDSNLSHTIQVDDDPIIVKAYNLVEGDVVLVEMVDGDGAGRAFAPFCPINGQACLTVSRNNLPIGIPGRYRFVLSRTDGSEPPIGQVIVRFGKATMSHEWLTAYMPCAK